MPRRTPRAAVRVGLPAVLLLAAAAFFFLRRGDLSADDAHGLVASGARLVDVRSPAEFAAGHLPGAVNVPVAEAARQLGELEPRDRPIVVYCHTGARAARAAHALRSAGFSSVHNLGAMGRW
jgi:rhodanese-related sulfurtransferase